MKSIPKEVEERSNTDTPYIDWYNTDMEEYKKRNPQDPYCNYYVPGWKDGSYNIGDWIWSHYS